ncbi:CYTH domain-containing protein [Streptomyces sp. DW26H14]|uniref:CYTH domain-containing protein n=1 Tax=Streptomyces sp. DW26H14 TaxID=3435395 RepID=UPI00403DC863
MGTEIERKFLVRATGWRPLAGETHRLRQGYLSTDPAREVRVRVVDESEAYLTIKAKQQGPVRAEFEYEIPVADARELLTRCTGRLIEKDRHHLATTAPGAWVVDAYTNAHEGLTVLEIEWRGWEHTTPPPFTLPDWVGRDVTGDRRYSNAALAAPGDA